MASSCDQPCSAALGGAGKGPPFRETSLATFTGALLERSSQVTLATKSRRAPTRTQGKQVNQKYLFPTSMAAGSSANMLYMIIIPGLQITYLLYPALPVDHRGSV